MNPHDPLPPRAPHDSSPQAPVADASVPASTPPSTASTAASASVTTSPDAAILAGFQVVCICRGIRRKTIEQAIRAGARTIPDVRRRTGATTGTCGATRCTPTINAMLIAVGGTPGPVPGASGNAVPRPGAGGPPRPRR
ncbi:MAG: (2Fe-2S)-binding protein [bacterium]